MTDDHYRRWSEPDCVRAFAEKGVEGFFESETRILRQILPDVRSVLDVGCASGRFLDLLRSYGLDPDYTGIDISAASVESARTLHPGGRFVHANALDYSPGRSFDLVNATGVCQHEPRFEALIDRMSQWSSRYVLFDVKLAQTVSHIVDRAKSFAGSEKNRLYFILLSYPALLAFLRARSGVRRIQVYGYETPLNPRTTVPPSVRRIVSAGILLEKDGGTAAQPDAAPEVVQQLPPFLAG
jgi:SAM-dependent methyltransferase